MKLLVLNPNTSDPMTHELKQTLGLFDGTEIRLDVDHVDFGVDSLESFYEYQLASFACIRYLQNTSNQYDGILLACYGDPGIYAMKEQLAIPVIGIAEASIATALLVGRTFGLLVATEKSVRMMEALLNDYMLQARCVKIEPINIQVAEIEKDKEKSFNALKQKAQFLIDAGAEVVILGCAGMTGFKDQLSKELNVIIIDPVLNGVYQLQQLIKQNLTTSNIGFYEKAMSKPIMKSELMK